MKIMKNKSLKFLSLILGLILIFNMSAIALDEDKTAAKPSNASSQPVKLSLKTAGINSDKSVGISLYMTAPEGVEVGGLQADIVFDSDSFTCSSDTDSDGKITVALLDFSDSGSEQLLASYSLLAADGIYSGYYTVSLKNIIIYDTDDRDLDYTAEDARFAVEGEEPEYTVTLADKSLNLAKGTRRKLSYTTTPENALSKDVSWSSGNERVAKVSADGTVTAVSAGTANIIVSYGKSSDICTVTVFETQSSQIMFERMPIKTFYYVGEKLNTLGLKLRIFTDRANSSVIDSGWTTKCDEFTSPGTYSVYVDYSGYGISYNVEVAERPQNADPLTPFETPKKDAFKKRELIGGRWPDLTGLAFWTESGGRVTFNRYSAEFSADSELHYGKNTATVKLGGYEYNFDFYYIEDDAPDSIDVLTAPAYAAKFGSFSDEISTFGLGVSKTEGDTETKIPVSELSFPEKQFKTEGENILEINYKGLPAYCLVEVAAPDINELNGIAVTEKPNKTEYLKGETVSFDGLRVAATYNGAMLGEIEDYTLKYDENFKVGDNTVTVEYKGFKTEFTVKILNPYPEKITGGTYKVTGGILLGVSAGTSVSEFLKNTGIAEYLTVSDADGNPISGGGAVCTGYILTLINPETGEISDRVTVAVTGDINGDGQVTAADENMLLNYLLNNTALDELQSAAADINGDSAVTITDLLNIRDIVKKN